MGRFLIQTTHTQWRECGERTRVERCGCFFFQAEDGIRDYKVTGVQTCALPIWQATEMMRRASTFFTPACPSSSISVSSASGESRSEERRVGKECRYPWSPY